jgi:hypothetical protein
LCKVQRILCKIQRILCKGHRIFVFFPPQPIILGRVGGNT